MIIEKTAPFTGELRRLEINISPDRWIAYLVGGKKSISRAFPELSIMERMFMALGILDEYIPPDGAFAD